MISSPINQTRVLLSCYTAHLSLLISHTQHVDTRPERHTNYQDCHQPAITDTPHGRHHTAKISITKDYDSGLQVQCHPSPITSLSPIKHNILHLAATTTATQCNSANTAETRHSPFSETSIKSAAARETSTYDNQGVVASGKQGFVIDKILIRKRERRSRIAKVAASCPTTRDRNSEIDKGKRRIGGGISKGGERTGEGERSA